MKTQLLASAATVTDLLLSIESFYCGETKALQSLGNDTFDILHTSEKRKGEKIEGVRVIKKKGRYRFEMLPLQPLEDMTDAGAQLVIPGAERHELPTQTQKDFF